MEILNRRAEVKSNQINHITKSTNTDVAARHAEMRESLNRGEPIMMTGNISATKKLVAQSFGMNTSTSDSSSIAVLFMTPVKAQHYVRINLEETSPTAKTNTYYALIPEPPTTDGTYQLRSTVSNGKPSFEWVTA